MTFSCLLQNIDVLPLELLTTISTVVDLNYPKKTRRKRSHIILLWQTGGVYQSTCREKKLVKPVDESQDLYKRQQFRELVILNNNLRWHSTQPRGSVSPFGSNRIKRVKIGFRGPRYRTWAT